MNQWGFFEVAGLEAWAKLCQLQWKEYGTKLDSPTLLWIGETKKAVGYPTLAECERNMKRPGGEVSPNKTRGI